MPSAPAKIPARGRARSRNGGTKACRRGEDIGALPLLQDYEAARRTDQHNVIQFSDKLVRGFSSRLPGWALLRNLGMVGFDLLPQAKQALARYAMGSAGR